MTDRSHAEAAPGVVDVSFYRDVRELYLAADVLVTDYSSVMFDFALTGKPIVYYAYDLDRFRDEIRGFYFDLVPQAPGPVVQTEDELVDALLHLDTDRWSQPYAAFRSTYGGLEDGHATDRVLEQLGAALTACSDRVDASSAARGVHVRGHLGGRLLAVRVGEAAHEGGPLEGVLLGADLLHDVHREQAAELGGTLEGEVPLQRREEARTERVPDTGRLDLARSPAPPRPRSAPRPRARPARPRRRG